MANTEPLYSSLATDPVLGEIVGMFVEEIPARIETMTSQAAANDWESLGRTAHQLKGAFGSHGFNQLTPRALAVEQAAREGQPEEEILASLEELIAMCHQMQAGPAPVETV